ncbi:MAG: hypothetical protein PHE77_01615 [Candidatus Pacebacteria bacterium]|nr:hypothetical protein [Candidatus Paceibacterota bacterium]
MLNPSPKHNIIFQWLFWHFVESVKNIFLGWKNFLRFNFNYFSVGQLLKSLFSPWKGDISSYGRGFDAARYFNTFLGNMISRVLGALIRLVLIVLGLVFGLGVFLAGALVLIVWICLPAIVVAGLFYAIGVVV